VRHSKSFHLGTVLAVPLLALALSLTGCGDRGDSKKNTANASEHDRQLQFAECMRENGVDMPDPGPAANGETQALPATSDKAKFDAAYGKCRNLLPNGGEAKAPSEEDRAAMLTFAKCMRENGVPDYPDPPVNGAGTVGNAEEVADPDNPEWVEKMKKSEAAAKKCGAPGAVGAVPAK
jgi:hypothetical protein